MPRGGASQTILETGGTNRPGGTARTAGALSSVAADLEAIFKEPPAGLVERPGPGDLPENPFVQSLSARPPVDRQRMMMFAAAAIVAAFIGVAVTGITMIARPPAPEPERAIRPAAVRLVPAARAQPTSPASGVAPAAVEPGASPALALTPSIHGIDQAGARARIARRTPARRPAVTTRPGPPAVHCGSGATRAGRACSYDALVTADRRLRHAYRNAVRAGVPRPALVSYRNRWAELRRGAGRNPARTAQDYRKLEMALSRAARPKAAHLLPRPRNAPVAHRGGRRLARR